MNRFMLVDDDEIFNLLHTEIIRQFDANAEIYSYTSSPDALNDLKAKIATGTDVPNFLFLDLRMPLLSGFDFLDELMKLDRSVVSHMKIFVLTSSLDNNDRERSESYPIVTGFEGKTLTSAKLRKLVGA